MIKNVMFDFVNTLAVLEPSKEEILREFSPCLEKVSDARIRNAYANLDEEMHYSSVKISSEKKRREFYFSYNKKLFKDLLIEGFETYYDFYKSFNKRWSLDEKALEIIEKLRDQKISIGVISNFDKNLGTIMEELGVLDSLDFMIVSEIEGIEKPDREFYRIPEQRHGINPNETLYVGDSYVLDYVPSKSLGYKSLIIDRGFIHQNVPDRIECLSEIPKVIKRLNYEK